MVFEARGAKFWATIATFTLVSDTLFSTQTTSSRNTSASYCYTVFIGGFSIYQFVKF
jgi:hypothetical protein